MGIINDAMTLDEKLAAIDAALATAVASVNGTIVSAPVDPADLTMCLGCQ